jgi:PilZ domain
VNPGMNWLARMLFRKHRKTERQKAPQLDAYYWNGAKAVPHSVRDISSTGAYIVTEERWHLGTILMVTLQGTDEYIDARPPLSISVQSKVVRSGIDGVGLTFLFPNKESALAHGADRKAFIAFSQSIGRG